MSFFSGLCVRPDPARVSPGAVRVALLAGLLACASPALATTLSVSNARVTRSNGSAAPPEINGTASASAVGAGDRVIMTGSIGEVSRATWVNAGLSGQSVRFIVTGNINDGVAAGDDVRFIYRFSITASAGTVSWIVRATAAAPPSQGFILSENGTAFSGGQLVEGEMGRTFPNASTMTGDFSMSIDVNWYGTSDPNATLLVSLHEAQVHLPTPSGGSLLIAAMAIRSRRRRRSA